MGLTHTDAWRVLLIDDDQDDYLLTRLLLADAKYRKIDLEWARSFQDGMQLIETKIYEAVLVDYDLNPKTGIELIQKVVARGIDLPLILFTSRGSYDVDVEAMQAGATLYLTKGEANPLLMERSIRYAIERKQTEKALRESEQRYRSIFNNHHTVMLIINPETAEIIDANPAACNYYEYSLAELRLMKVTDLNVLTSSQVHEEMQRAVAESRNQFLFRHRRKSGDVRDVEVNSGPIMVEGKLLLYSIIFDVTERIQKEKEIRQLSLFPGENPSPVMRVNADGVLLYANKASSVFLSEWVCTVGEIVPAEWIEFVQAALSSNSTNEVQTKCREKIYSFILQPFAEERYVNLYGRDVTEYQYIKQERDRLLVELKNGRDREQA